MKRFLPLFLIIGLFSTVFLLSCEENDPVISLDDIRKPKDTLPGKYDERLTYGGDTIGAGTNLGDLRVTVHRMSEAGPKLEGVRVNLYANENDMTQKQNIQYFDETDANGVVLFEDLPKNSDWWAFGIHVEDQDTLEGFKKGVIQAVNAPNNISLIVEE